MCTGNDNRNRQESPRLGSSRVVVEFRVQTNMEVESERELENLFQSLMLRSFGLEHMESERELENLFQNLIQMYIE